MSISTSPNSLSDGYGSVQGLPVAQNTFAEVAIDELDNIRLREVTGKAISGSLLLLLKWFKRSRKDASLFHCVAC